MLFRLQIKSMQHMNYEQKALFLMTPLEGYQKKLTTKLPTIRNGARSERPTSVNEDVLKDVIV